MSYTNSFNKLKSKKKGIFITKRDIEAKLKAIKFFKGEVRPDPHPTSPEVVKALAKIRGSEAGFMYAEAFMINKLYQK